MFVDGTEWHRITDPGKQINKPHSYNKLMFDTDGKNMLEEK